MCELASVFIERWGFLDVKLRFRGWAVFEVIKLGACVHRGVEASERASEKAVIITNTLCP